MALAVGQPGRVRLPAPPKSPDPQPPSAEEAARIVDAAWEWPDWGAELVQRLRGVYRNLRRSPEIDVGSHSVAGQARAAVSTERDARLHARNLRQPIDGVVRLLDRCVNTGHVPELAECAGLPQLLERLRELERPGSPFGGEFTRARGWPGRGAGRGEVRWVEPVLVGEIEYRSFTHDGSFRHPSWRGLRRDRDPHDVQLPPPD